MRPQAYTAKSHIPTNNQVLTYLTACHLGMLPGCWGHQFRPYDVKRVSRHLTVTAYISSTATLSIVLFSQQQLFWLLSNHVLQVLVTRRHGVNAAS